MVSEPGRIICRQATAAGQAGAVQIVGGETKRMPKQDHCPGPFHPRILLSAIAAM